LGVAVVLILLATACSSSSSGGTPATSGSSTTLSVKDFAFEPTTLSVPSGTVQITITNTGPTKHSFTLDDGSVSQDVLPGATETVTLDVTATVGFHCKYHPTTMKGTLQVG
jgi:plastocyanin